MKRIYCGLLALGLALGASGCGQVRQPEAVETVGEAQVEVEKPKYVALTFDDGPRYNTTGPLLDGLAKRGVVATFFVIGRQVEGNEDLICRMAADGHQIGNHTYSHVALQDLDPDAVVEEIQKTEVVLEHLVGEREFWLRPPYGLIDSSRAALVDTPMVYWTVDPEDWRILDSDRVAEAVVSKVESGDVVLLHDFYPTSVEAALEIVDRLAAEGYTFVTVEQLFRINGVAPQAGVLYASPEKTEKMPGEGKEPPPDAGAALVDRL